MILKNIEPTEVFTHFEAISMIPRGSGNEKAVSDYIAVFAKNLALNTVQDERNNLIIYKPGTAGYETSPVVILQAHLDMVCEMNAGTVHDFLKDPIKLTIDGDLIKANGTTLGADNGIGVAICMALLASTTIPHPPLEIVLTTDEETGMGGAYALDAAHLQGKRMINLDTDRDDTFIMGCAAGTTVSYKLPVTWVSNNQKNYSYRITVKGLKGGHSGADITLERGNANKILGLLLSYTESTVHIGGITGGMKVNAIAREAFADISCTPEIDLEIKLTPIIDEIKKQYKVTDPDLNITIEPINNLTHHLSPESKQNLLASILLFPDGVLAMSQEITGLANQSCNLGVIEIQENDIQFFAMPRGMTRFFNQQTEQTIRFLAAQCSADVTFSQRSPAWPFNAESTLMQVASDAYVQLNGTPPKVTAIHAGLECGLFADKLGNMDIISFGPNAYDIHTPEEALSIASTQKVYRLVQEILKNLK